MTPCPSFPFEGKRHRVGRFDGRPDRLLISFEYGRNGPVAFVPPICPAFAVKRGLTVLKVQTTRRDWFVSPEMPDLMAVIHDLTQPFDQSGARIICMGFSMGGFAALAFSLAAHADAVIAISPQYSIDPAVAPFDPKRKEKFQALGMDFPVLSELGACDVPGVVLFDPQIPEDAQHAALIGQDFPHLDLISLPFAGHPASLVLAKRMGMGRIVDMAFDENIDARAIRSHHRQERKQVARYMLNLADAGRGRHPKRAGATYLAIAVDGTVSMADRMAAAQSLGEMGDPRGPEMMRLLEAIR